jgi:hypothetical protein
VTVTASDVFEFLERRTDYTIDRRELHSEPFTILRRNVRSIVARLSETEEVDSLDLVDRLRTILSEWLTVPVPFEEGVLESISLLGEPAAIETRWGHEIRESYDHARSAARAVQATENPLRAQVREAIHQVRADGVLWRIYCHRRARPHFESLFADNPLPPEVFLHSAREYREATLFDVLVKVGPLRSRGWGAAPDALLSAPRFSKLLQIVWSGSSDEQDFGYDPVATRLEQEAIVAGPLEQTRFGNTVVSWTQRVTRIGEVGADVEDVKVDELKFFHELTRSSDVRRATLVQIDQADGILYPPHSEVPSLDPGVDDQEAIGYRLAGDTLAEGMFVIWPLLGDADLGSLHAGDGQFSRIWKGHLRAEFRDAPDELIRRLRAGGIELRNLRSCVRQWCRPPSTVIHAPQQRRHFEILIRVLGIQREPPFSSGGGTRPWWEYGWSEIGATRGEAIQTGMQEHEIIDEQLFSMLRTLLPSIRMNSHRQSVFEVVLPTDGALPGTVRFYKIRSIEEGFLVPDTLLKTICDLDTIEQWRV